MKAELTIVYEQVDLAENVAELKGLSKFVDRVFEGGSGLMGLSQSR